MKVFVTLCAVLFLAGTSVAQVKISGDAPGGEGKQVFLYELVQNKPVAVDSSAIDGSGKFNMNVSPKEVAFYRLGPKENDFGLLILGKKKENIKVSGDYKTFNATYTVDGSKDSELMVNFLNDAKVYMRERDSLNRLYQAKNNDPAIRDEINKLGLAFMADRDKWVEDNKESPAVLVALQYLNAQKDFVPFKTIVESAQKTMPGSFYANALKQQLTALIVPGNDAPELAYPDPAGEVRKLSDLKGSVVLIDFWASWCGPCRKENPHVVHAYEKYHEKGFEVLSVSLDRDANRWRQAIQQDGLVWPHHISDLKQWKSEAAKKYGVSSIPFTVLVDREGKIIATKLRGPQLSAKLTEMFGF